MKKSSILITILITFLYAPAFANEEKEQIYLFQLLNQLNAMKPLVIAASKEQPKTTRGVFNYTGYCDGHGKFHNGLINNINQMEEKIHTELDHLTIEPHRVLAIKGDYLVHERAK